MSPEVRSRMHPEISSRLATLLKPRSIAVIGASNNLGNGRNAPQKSAGNRIFGRNLPD